MPSTRFAPQSDAYEMLFLRTAKDGRHLDYVYEATPLTPPPGASIDRLTIDGANFLPRVVRFHSSGPGREGSGEIEFAPVRKVLAAGAGHCAGARERQTGARAHRLERLPLSRSLPPSTFQPPEAAAARDTRRRCDARSNPRTSPAWSRSLVTALVSHLRADAVQQLRPAGASVLARARLDRLARRVHRRAPYARPILRHRSAAAGDACCCRSSRSSDRTRIRRCSRIVLAGVAIGAAWELGERFGLRASANAWICAFFLAGTDLLWCAMLGDVWFIAHVSRRRASRCSRWSSSPESGAAGWSRCLRRARSNRASRWSGAPGLRVLCCVAAARAERDDRARLVRRACSSPVAALWMLYNRARWGTWSDIGYTAWYHQDQAGMPTGSPFRFDVSAAISSGRSSCRRRRACQRFRGCARSTPASRSRGRRRRSCSRSSRVRRRAGRSRSGPRRCSTAFRTFSTTSTASRSSACATRSTSSRSSSR